MDNIFIQDFSILHSDVNVKPVIENKSRNKFTIKINENNTGSNTVNFNHLFDLFINELLDGETVCQNLIPCDDRSLCKPRHGDGDGDGEHKLEAANDNKIYGIKDIDISALSLLLYRAETSEKAMDSMNMISIDMPLSDKPNIANIAGIHDIVSIRDAYGTLSSNVPGIMQNIPDLLNTLYAQDISGINNMQYIRDNTEIPEQINLNEGKHTSELFTMEKTISNIYEKYMSDEINQSENYISKNTETSLKNLDPYGGISSVSHMIKEASGIDNDEAGIIDQIIEHISEETFMDRKEIKIDLKPDFLGKMTIRVVMRNGNVIAQIKTANNELSKQISEQLPMLKESMQEKGMNIHDVEVSCESMLGSGSGLGLGFGTGANYNHREPGRYNSPFISRVSSMSAIIPNCIEDSIEGVDVENEYRSIKLNHIVDIST